MRQHPGADLERKGYGEQDWHFSKEFYTKVVEDLSIINDNFLKVLKVSRHLDRYAGRVNMQDGIAHIRKLKEYLEYFSFKDIISRTTKPPKKDHLQPTAIDTQIYYCQFGPRGRHKQEMVRQQQQRPDNPKQYPMDNIQLVDSPVGMNMTQIVWNAAHRIYNLRELVVLMLNSGAAFGTIMKNPFIPGAAAAVQTPHQAISFLCSQNRLP